MFKAMSKLNLGASVVKHRRAGSGTGGSRHGSAQDLSRAFEETSVSASPDLADVPRSLEAWAEQDSEDFDAGAFAAEHYGDAGERRVARLHAVLSALQTEAGDQMKRNVLDHHAAFVEVAREISRLTETTRALRDLAAIPSDAVDALLADAEADAAKKRARRANEGDADRMGSASPTPPPRRDSSGNWGRSSSGGRRTPRWTRRNTPRSSRRPSGRARARLSARRRLRRLRRLRRRRTRAAPPRRARFSPRRLRRGAPRRRCSRRSCATIAKKTKTMAMTKPRRR